MNKQLTGHFTLDELTKSDIAKKKGFDNSVPNRVIYTNLQRLAEKLEEVREIIGTPLIITSGYRCTELNKAVGSTSMSSHLKGLAADFHSTKLSTKEVYDILYKKCMTSTFECDQCIHEVRVKTGTKWIHLSIAEDEEEQRNDFFKMKV